MDAPAYGTPTETAPLEALRDAAFHVQHDKPCDQAGQCGDRRERAAGRFEADRDDDEQGRGGGEKAEDAAQSAKAAGGSGA